jgi:uncharacterized protein (DUF427 family)
VPVERVVPGPGQESVWDYPRPPRLEDCPRRIRIDFGGVTIAETGRAKRLLETSHPPAYYLPPEDVTPGVLIPTASSTWCEYKGRAVYFTVRAGGREVIDAAWAYPEPTTAFAAMAGYVAFYAGPMDACWVDDERAEPQPGGFYGGWVTRDVVGPFKGDPGTLGW